MRQVSLIAAVITVMLSTAPMCYARVAKQKLSIAPDVCLGDGDDGTVSQFVNKGGKFPLFVRIDGSDDLAGGVLAPITPTVATDCRFSMTFISLSILRIWRFICNRATRSLKKAACVNAL
jgi:hypothetical protein